MADINTTQVNQSLSGLTQEVQSLTIAIRTLLASQSNIESSQHQRRQEIQRNTADLTDFSKKLRDGRKTTEEQDKLIKEAVALKKQEIATQRKLQKAIEDRARGEAAKLNDEAMKQLTQSVEDASDAHLEAQEALQDGVKKVEKSFTGLTKSIDWAGVALTWFGSAVTKQAQTLIAQNKANGGLVEGTGNIITAMAQQQTEALKYKLDAAAFANITVGARQMFNAMGGTSKGLAVLDESIQAFTITTGSFEEGLRTATRVAQDFATKGVRPTSIGMQLYQNDLTNLRRQTGLSIDQAHDLYNSVAEDMDSIALLRKVRDGERETILRNQRAMIQQSIAMGMTAEQAKEAAKMLNKMVAAKPLDRLRQAARVQALSGAMGIQGGQEAAAAIRAGSRATPEQQQFLADFSKRAANAFDQAAGQGMASEIFATTLYDKLQLDQYYGQGSQFSTTLGTTLQNANGELAQKIIDATKDPAAQMITQAMGIVEQLKLIVSGQHWFGPIAAGVAAIAAMMMKGSSLTDTLGKGASGGAKGKAPGGIRKLSNIGPAVGKLGALGAAADVGFGINNLANGERQETLEGFDMLSPMKWGMWAGEKFNKGVEGFTGGRSPGSWLYDQFNDDPLAAPMASPQSNVPLKGITNPSTASRANSSTDVSAVSKEIADTSTTIATATQTTADNLGQQVKKTDVGNELLKSLVGSQQKLIDLAERQLVATTLTDREKSDVDQRTILRGNNKFASTYQYL